MKSPCNDICKIDRPSGLCIGCGRTLSEIGEWESRPWARSSGDEMPGLSGAAYAFTKRSTSQAVSAAVTPVAKLPQAMS